MSSNQIIGIMMTMTLGALYMWGAWRVYRRKLNESFLTWQAEATVFLVLGIQCMYIMYLLYRYPQYTALLAKEIVLGMLFLLPSFMVIIISIIWRLRMKMERD